MARGGDRGESRGQKQGGGPEYQETTRGIEVTVRTAFLADQSDPGQGRWVWAYRITIRNTGQETVQLLRRTWRITDSRGRVQEVHGPGVVGEQPVLQPGEEFEYTSGTPLDTPSGFMAGQYHMTTLPGREPFDAAIPTFSLDSPGGDAKLH